MPEVRVRKFVICVEEILHEGGPATAIPPRRAAILAVIENPYAGKYHAEIASFMDDLKPLGLAMARRLGFEIPQTLITNDPGAVKSFREQCGGAALAPGL